MQEHGGLENVLNCVLHGAVLVAKLLLGAVRVGVAAVQAEHWHGFPALEPRALHFSLHLAQV